MENPALLPLPIDLLCRICLMEIKGDAISLFTKQEKSREIVSKIKTCFNINIGFERYLPNCVCKNCEEELNVANNFRLKCLTFDQKFAIICKQVKIKAQSCDTLTSVNDIHSESIQSDLPEDTYDGTTLAGEVKVKSEIDLALESIKKKNPHFLLKDDDDFKCNICGKVLKSKLSLSKHYVCMHQRRKHVGRVSGCGVTRRYHCTRCAYSTPHSQTLVNHVRRHDGIKPYQCECGKRFTQNSSLTAHRKIHSNTTFYTCSMCGKQFKHAFSLKKHLLVHENGNYSCEICHKTLKTKQSLQDHMYRHYNIRNYSCEDCGDTFVTSSELQNHRQKHSMEKKVECHLCGYRTNTKKSLIMHLKRHAGDKSLKCVVCTSSFYTGGELRRHARVHSREKPYQCPACAQRLSHSSSLNKHMLNVHGIRYKWADFNGQDARKIKELLTN